jgi:thioredoxin 1
MRVVPDAPLHAEGADLERILATGRPTLVVFETPDCEPCRRLEPILDALARDYRGRILVVRVNASAGWLAARHHLSYVPTLTFWSQGTEQARIRGNPGGGAVRSHVECLLSGADVPEPVSGTRHSLVARFSPSGRPLALLSSGVPSA